jgi:hypothetical protein
MEIKDYVAEVLVKHSIKNGIRDMSLHCHCGWTTSLRQAGGGGLAYRLHVAEMLEAEGLLVRRRRPMSQVRTDTVPEPSLKAPAVIPTVRTPGAPKTTRARSVDAARSARTSLENGGAGGGVG